jgi:hypothetical protein
MSQDPRLGRENVVDRRVTFREVPVLSLISWLWGCSSDVETPREPELIRSEMRRLDEMIRGYREFGYEDMAAECAQRKQSLEKELSRLRRV